MAMEQCKKLASILSELYTLNLLSYEGFRGLPDWPFNDTFGVNYTIYCVDWEEGICFDLFFRRHKGDRYVLVSYNQVLPPSPSIKNVVSVVEAVEALGKILEEYKAHLRSLYEQYGHLYDEALFSII